MEQLAKVCTERGWTMAVLTQVNNVLCANVQQVMQSVEVRGQEEPGSDYAEAVQKVKQVLSGVANVSLKIKCCHSIGTQMSTINNINKICVDGKTATGLTQIEHKDGQILVLYFWATWCEPCLPILSQYQELFKKRSQDWADRVRLIGLLTDDDMKIAIPQALKYAVFEHYSVRADGCTVQRDYGVDGVP